MFVVLAVAAAAVIAAAMVLATGRGGELAFFPPAPCLDLPTNRHLKPKDLWELRLPRRLTGYRATDVDELLQYVGYALAERDSRIAVLEQRVTQMYERERARERQTREEMQRAVHDSEETW